jgi:hypothetical protein
MVFSITTAVNTSNPAYRIVGWKHFLESGIQKQSRENNITVHVKEMWLC